MKTEELEEEEDQAQLCFRQCGWRLLANTKKRFLKNFLAHQGKARACSTNTVVIKSSSSSDAFTAPPSLNGSI